MFSTCCFCHAPLGANDAIEHFPVGRRIAFDGERGRLWAVCFRCSRWNLAPIEERWEALEACEKAYRGATQRVSTDNVALARLKDGTDLIRIGRPLLPEFAAWRYGDMVRDRRRRLLRGHVASRVTTAMSAGVVVATVGVGAQVGILSAALIMSGVAGWWTARVERRPFAAALPAHGEAARRLARRPWRVRVSRDATGAWAIEETPSLPGLPRWLASGETALRLTGAEARAAMPPLLTALAPFGSSPLDVSAAAARYDATPDAETIFDAIANHRWMSSDASRGSLNRGDPAMRLALEMALHDEDERRALAGELGTLYARWEEAERVVRIADGELS